MKSRAHGSFGSLSSARTLGLVGALALGGAASLAACLSPGKLDCAEVDCGGGSGGDQQGGSGGGNSGGSGGGGGGGGNSGGSGGGSGSPAAVPDDTAVADCEYKTVKDVETNLLASSTKCGQCHNSTKIGPTDFKTAGVRQRLIDIKPMMTCTDSKLVDTSDATKSLLVVKVKGEKLPCPVGSGDSMGDMKAMTSGFTDAHVTCLTNYAKALAEAAKK